MKTVWVYIDTSTYLKLYVKEKGSEDARKLVAKNRLITSAILSSECFSALSRKKHGNEMDEKTFDQLVGHIKNGLPSLEIMRLTDDVLKKTEDVTLRSTARTLDALHIATALVFQDLTGIEPIFVTSDKKQEEVAKREGLRTMFVG